MKLHTFVFFFTFCSSIAAFSLPYGLNEFKNNSNLPSIVQNSVPCKKDNTCDGLNKKCNENNFCVCLDGYEGGNCDIVTGCINLKKKCDEIEKECIFDGNAPGKAVCQCDGGFKYDSENNKCQESADLAKN